MRRLPCLLMFPVTLTAYAELPPSGAATVRPSAEHLLTPSFETPITPSFVLPDAQTQLLKPAKTIAPKILLKGVSFSGNSVIADAELQNIARPFLNKPTSIVELEALRQAISQHYSRLGYVNSGAILPEQSFENGTIRFDIIEGRLSAIDISGTERLNPDYVRKRLEQDEDAPLNVNALQESFQLLLLDPLIERMNGQLLPGRQRGESLLNVAVTRALPYQVNLSFDNYRPPSVSAEEGTLSGWVRNLTGLGDMFSGGITYANGGIAGGSGDFSIPLNAYDTRLYLSGSVSNTSVIEEPLRVTNIDSEFISLAIGLQQPLIKKLNRSLNVTAEFNYKENTTSMLGQHFSFSPGADDGVIKDSVIRLTLDYTERLEQQVLSARSVTSIGINAFDATWHKNPNVPDGDFVAWLGQAQYANKMKFGTLILRGDVQYTDNQLLSMERFVVGGRYSVRGYRENEMVRDKGYVLSAEFRHPFLPEYTHTLGEVTLFPFFDFGSAWNNVEYNTSADQNHDLYSVGIGLEWQPVKYMESEIMFAHALRTPEPKSTHDLQDSGVFWRVNFSAF